MAQMLQKIRQKLSTKRSLCLALLFSILCLALLFSILWISASRAGLQLKRLAATEKAGLQVDARDMAGSSGSATGVGAGSNTSFKPGPKSNATRPDNTERHQAATAAAAESADAEESVPAGFNVNMYKLLNDDLAGLSDSDAVLHYLKWGRREGRVLGIPASKFNRTAESFIRLMSADWNENPGANKSGIHFTCMSTFQRRNHSVNTTRVLEEAVLTFMQTTPPTSKLWIVDDSSTCPTHVASLKLLETAYPSRLVLHRKQTNGGITESKNTCIRWFLQSRAQYLTLVDHDVYFKLDGWQKAYEAALNCGIDHLQHNMMFGVDSFNRDSVYHHKCRRDCSMSHLSPFWWVSHQDQNSRSWAKLETQSEASHRHEMLQQGSTILLRDLANVGSFGYFYTFNRALVVILGGYAPFPHPWGHEHTEYHRRARFVSKLCRLGLLDGGPNISVPRVLDIVDSNKYMGCHIHNGGMFNDSAKAQMARENGVFMEEHTRRVYEGKIHVQLGAPEKLPT